MSRGKVLQVRVNDVEHAKIKERALAAGKQISEFVRDRALGAAPSNGSPKREEAPAQAPGTSTDPDRDAFINRRAKQLHGAGGHTSRRARELAAEEWAAR